MEQIQGNRFEHALGETDEASIFDDLKPLPVYYSERAIYTFSVLFGILFGSILMAINLKNTPAKKGITQVIIFAILYTAIEVTALSYISGSNTALTLAFNGAGALILRKLIWEKYIGKDVKYSKRSVLIPAIIGIVFAMLIILGIISTLDV